MPTEITIEGLGGANVARIASDPVASGTEVQAGDALLEVENHKVVQEVTAPSAGIFVHALSKGDFVQLGRAVAFVADEAEDQNHLLDLARRALASAEDWTFVIADRDDARHPGTPVSVRKATEIAVLGNGAGNSMMAMLGAKLGRVRRGPATADFFQEKILDLLVYEASRLLKSKKFAPLNSSFSEGKIVPHATVNAGVGLDEGGRLVLYSLRDSDHLALAEVQSTLLDGLMRYVGRKLTIEEVATSTFSITDVSASRLNFTLPLLPRGQCIIIAVTKNAAEEYSLIVSFDHRITEGMLVAAFLEELTTRVRSYGESEVPALGTALACAFCGRTLETEVGQFGRRGLIAIADASGAPAHCCSTCWENW